MNPVTPTPIHPSSYDHVVFTGAAPVRPLAISRRVPIAGPQPLNVRPPTSLPDCIDIPGADAFVCWLLARAGIEPAAYRPDALRRRVGACLRALHARDVDRARAILEANPRRLRPAVSALLIGVTAFFRDAETFDHLRRTVIPEVLHRVPRPAVWSAGCSTGHELYSVAMLIDDAGRLDDVALVGTDCRSDALAGAASASYADAEFQSLPEPFASRYVVPTSGGPRLSDPLRRAARWVRQDVLTVAPRPGRFDLILCRNVAIYLRPDVAEQLWRRLVQHLSPGGYLVVGRAEKVRLPGLARTGPCTYRYAGGAPA